MRNLDHTLPAVAKKFLRTKRGRYCGTQVRQIHQLLADRNLEISAMTTDLVETFLAQKQRQLQLKTNRVYKCQLLTYLDYLYRKKLISFDPETMRIRPTVLPPPEAAKEFLETDKGYWCTTTTRKFHRWLEREGLSLDALRLEHVHRVLKDHGEGVAVSTGIIYKNQLFVYLDYLYGSGKICFDPKPLRIKPESNPLPSSAHDYLKAQNGNHSKSTLRSLHRWLQENDYEISDVDPEVLYQFKLARSTTVSEKTLHMQWLQILRYLEYLHSTGRLAFDPERLREPSAQLELPERAKEFLSNYGAVIKESTIKHYLSSLRRLYKWLEVSELSTDDLKSLHIERFAKWMIDEGLHPNTRYGTFVCIRVYFRWLGDHGFIGIDADELIKPEIFPKLPHYLPRPFPQEADIEMQARLAKSKDLYHQGLLLMRSTGMRIGELINLEFDCLQYSHDRLLYLKVPLGKLNNERLVPIDQKTHRLIKRLQRGRSSSTSTYLLETPRGNKTHQMNYSKALKDICNGLDLHGPAQTHRLRHTYATSMLNGGMSLVGLMKLLGHHDHRMTLRYSAITTDTVRDEYMMALGKLQQRYKDIGYKPEKSKNPRKQIKDAVRWVKKNCVCDDQQVQARLGRIILRLERAENDLGALMNDAFADLL